MVRYWLARYSDAVVGAREARTQSVRSAYSQLADHYLSMIQFTEGRGPPADQVPGSLGSRSCRDSGRSRGAGVLIFDRRERQERRRSDSGRGIVRGPRSGEAEVTTC
jgi:hypothetical protein